MGEWIKMYIDFDKIDGIFYINYYLDDCKLVLKIAIDNSEDSASNIKIEEFNLSKKIYLMNYD